MNERLTELHDKLEEIFAANFVAYYRAHQCHINIRSRNFYADHKLLKHIYSYLQDNIDVLGEKIQACGVGGIPHSLEKVISNSPLADDSISGDADDLLYSVWESLNELIDVYHEVDEVAQEVKYPDVSNMAADHIGTIAAFAWKIEATLDLEGRHKQR